MPALPQRKSIRLKNYDYSSSGYYFLTLCTYKHQCFFGEIKNQKMYLNQFGKIVQNVWKSLPDHHPIKLDQFQIMPNHLHFIIQIRRTGAPWCARIPKIESQTHAGAARSAPTLGNIIRLFKSTCTKKINRSIRAPRGAPYPARLWHRNYYEHIIHHPKSLIRIRQYILNNPQNWLTDKYFSP